MGELKKPARRAQRVPRTRGTPRTPSSSATNITADLLTETAMAWHLEAVGSGGVRGTGDKKTMALAAQLYDKVVKTFKQEEFAKFEFPRIVKEDWPTIFKIKYAMADLLYFNKDWAKCGPGLRLRRRRGPERPAGRRGRVRRGALLPEHLHRARTRTAGRRRAPATSPTARRADRGQEARTRAKLLAPKEFTERQKGMITAFNRYVCYIKPAAE